MCVCVCVCTRVCVCVCVCDTVSGVFCHSCDTVRHCHSEEFMMWVQQHVYEDGMVGGWVGDSAFANSTK